MSLLPNLRPGGRHGVASSETRDPIGYLVAGLSRLAQTDLLDRLGPGKQAREEGFTGTPSGVHTGAPGGFRVPRSGFSPVPGASRTFARAGKRGQAGVRTPSTKASGEFDLTPTE